MACWLWNPTLQLYIWFYRAGSFRREALKLSAILSSLLRFSLHRKHDCQSSSLCDWLKWSFQLIRPQFVFLSTAPTCERMRQHALAEAVYGDTLTHQLQMQAPTLWSEALQWLLPQGNIPLSYYSGLLMWEESFQLFPMTGACLDLILNRNRLRLVNTCEGLFSFWEMSPHIGITLGPAKQLNLLKG